MAVQAFVPAIPGSSAEPGLSALRGAGDARLPPIAVEEQGGAQLLGLAATVTGLAGLARVRGRNPRGARRQPRVCAAAEAEAAPEAPAATEEAAAGAEEEAPPPPPPPFNPADQVGVTAPLGFFDPLGFSKVGDEQGFRKLREAELKHGRVAMMASAGLLVQSVAPFRFFEEVPRGIAAAYTGIGLYGTVLLFIASGALELLVWKQDPEKDVGDFGDPAGWGVFNKDPDPLRRAEWVQGFKERELNNGRFAMFATVGILAAEILTGKTAWAQFGFTFEG
mmetsp:Transcript_67740/g.211893  ORF Transcript_67740/g.211893 Transcript_67740/m.211893 type:complete len:279 (+) Transcript_67740:65-901(+)